MPLPVSCTTEEKVKITVTPQTASGNTASIDGAVRVSVQSGAGSFTQDPAFPLEFYVVSGDVPGDTVYVVEADADLGPGEDQVSLIQDTVTLTVNNVNAASFGLSAGAPEPK